MHGARDGRGDLVEYELDDQIQSALEITTDENGFEIKSPERIEQQLYVHDDCFFFVKPVDEMGLGRLARAILEQHSFYLGTDVAWAGVLDQIILRLRTV